MSDIRGWECGCPLDHKHTGCPLHAKSDVYYILHIPEPPMTRCPKCGEQMSYNEGVEAYDCRNKACENYAFRIPAPATSPLDFEAAGFTGMGNGPRATALNAQAAALVKAERERIVKTLRNSIPVSYGGDPISVGYATGWEKAADYIAALEEARDDHR